MALWRAREHQFDAPFSEGRGRLPDEVGSTLQSNIAVHAINQVDIRGGDSERPPFFPPIGEMMPNNATQSKYGIHMLYGHIVVVRQARLGRSFARAKHAPKTPSHTWVAW